MSLHRKKNIAKYNWFYLLGTYGVIVSQQPPGGHGYASYIFNMEAHVHTTVEYSILCEKGDTDKLLINMYEGQLEPRSWPLFGCQGWQTAH